MTSLLKLFTVIAFFWCAQLAAVSQTQMVYMGDTINITDASKLKQGLWITFDGSGLQVVERGNYVNNKKEGIWTRNYPNGKTKHEITFKNGTANGTAKFYFENGNLWETGTWVVDHWVGPYEFYHANGQKAYDWNYNSAGKRTGTQNYYHENGKLKYTGDWLNGKTTGSLKVYDEKGILVAERVYEEGKFEKSIDRTTDAKSETAPSQSISQFTGTGQHTIYNLSGQIDKSGFFENGKLMDGFQLVYDQDGKATTRLIFEKGTLTKSVVLK